VFHDLLHGLIPINFLFVCLKTGSFAWHLTLLSFGGCLNSSVGGFLECFLSIVGFFVMVIQCFFIILDTLGNFELNDGKV
jgi:hypothetical protein